MPDVVTTDSFVLFWNGWPSQWHPSPFVVDGIPYSCAEQFMMVEKARVFGDDESARRILEARRPGEQKRLGRSVRGFDRATWQSVCLGVVFNGNIAKFTQNSGLREALLGTVGKRLVEASPTDVIWGIGLDQSDPRALDPAQWNGTNWLGLVLDQVREHLSAGLDPHRPPSDPEILAQVARRGALNRARG